MSLFSNQKSKLGALIVALIASGSFVESTYFCTRTPSTESVPLQLTSRVEKVRLGLRTTTTPTCDNFNDRLYLPRTILDGVPKMYGTIDWHLYSLQNESDEPRIALEPTNLLIPQLNDETGVLEFQLQSILLRYSGWATVAVALWLPSSYMTSLELVPPSEPETFVYGDDTYIIKHAVDITYNGTQPLHVHNAGVGNQVVSITSHRAEVYYNATGAQTTANIDATGQRTTFSKVSLSGENVAAFISVPVKEESSDMPSVQVDISGTNNEVKIDGSYSSISMTGTAARAFVNTNCRGFSRGTVNAGECYFDTNVDIYERQCSSQILSDLCHLHREYEAGKKYSVQDDTHVRTLSRGSVGGLVGGSVVLVAILGCVIHAYLRRRSFSTSVTGTNHDEEALDDSFDVAGIPIDPHLITAKLPPPQDSEPKTSTVGILQ